MATNNNIVAELLRRDNHENWSACMKNYLLSQDLWEVVEDETKRPKPEEGEEGYKSWTKKNAGALHAIQISCSPDLLAYIRVKTSAKDAWDTLADLCKHTAAGGLSLMEGPTNYLRQPDIGSGGHNNESIYRPSLDLLKAICRGNLNTVKLLLDKHPDLVKANLLRFSQRVAFSFAIPATLEIVDQFLPGMSKEDLENMNCKWKDTALHYTAMYKGKTKIAQRLIEKNKDLLTIPDPRKEIPLVTACKNGHEDIIHYLYFMTPLQFLLSPDGLHYANMALCYCIANEIFDVPLHLLYRRPQLAVCRANTNAIWRLSCQTSAFLSTSELSFWQRCVYYCLRVKKPDPSSEDVRIYTHQQDQEATKSFFLRGIKQIYDLKQKHLYAKELLVLISETIAGLSAQQIDGNGVKAAIFNAAQQGMTEFIIPIIKANMDLLWAYDRNGRNIFQCAVANRQEKTFSLIYGLEFRKTDLSTYTDKEGNNILHLAGQLSNYSQSQLAQISGAALQMQRELQWFKEVESIVSPASKKLVNKNGKTAHELFNESHADMIKEGEKWMKDIAQSSIIVGTLIITIMFATLYTVPGGNNPETGVPLLLKRKAFKVFVISDAISLFASSTSVLVFVGLLTSRYTAEDFLQSLPTKLIIALSSLFLSIATMMIAFSSTVIIMLKGQLAIVIPIVLLASVPVSLFIWLQFPLLVKMIISTYGPGIFNRKMKNRLIKQLYA